MKNLFYFCQLRTFSKKILFFGREKSAALSTLISTSPKEGVFWNCYLGKKFSSSILIFQQIKQTFSEIFWAGLSKLQPTCPDECFSEMQKIQKTTNFIFFCLSTVIFEPVDDWFMVALWKLDSGCPEERFEEKTLLNIFLIFCERSGKYFQQPFQKYFLCAQSNFLSRTSVKYKFLHPFINLSRGKSQLGQFL